jgi:hypothetical protein
MHRSPHANDRPRPDRPYPPLGGLPTGSAHPVLALQRTAGNAAITRLVRRTAPSGPVVQRMKPGESSGEDRTKRFYLALDQNIRMLLGKVRFGAAVNFYNPEFWETGEQPDALYLRPGHTPSEAIAQLHSHKGTVPGVEGEESAKLDCVEIIEVARWLAELDVSGREGFDKKYGGQEFKLAAPGSTGIEQEHLGVRVGQQSDGEFKSSGGPIDGRFAVTANGTPKMMMKLPADLAKLPVGSRIMWRNFDKAFPSDHDFKNENTIKLGDDTYAAHPFGIFNLAGVAKQIALGGFEDIQELRTSLAEAEKQAKSGSAPEDLAQLHKDAAYYDGIDTIDEYIERFVRIVEVEAFHLPT